MGNYIYYKEKDGITNVMEGDSVLARYKVDKHWAVKNSFVKDDDTISIRLHNRTKGFVDCEIKLNVEEIQEIPK